MNEITDPEINDQPVEVFVAADGRYLTGVQILISSILKYLHPGKELCLHFCTRDIDFARSRLNAFSDTVAINYLDAKALADDYGLVSKNAWYFLWYIAPKVATTNRIIVIDADILVLRDLSALTEVDLNGHAVAGVLDGPHPRCGMDPQLREHGNVDTKAPYLNAGFLVIDPVEWNRRNLTESAIREIPVFTHYRFRDQTLLNFLLQGQCVVLDETWNLIAPNYNNAVRTGPAVIHFIGPAKPWVQKGSFKAAYFAWYKMAHSLNLAQSGRGASFAYLSLQKLLGFISGLLPSAFRYVRNFKNVRILDREIPQRQ